MMNDRFYKWECGIDHSWIAEDKSGAIAYFACSLDDALPCKVFIDKRLMAGMDSRLKAHFEVKPDVDTGIFDLLATKGLFVYDAVRTVDGVEKYVLVGRPDRPVRSDSLPLSLKVVACCFAIRRFEFFRREQLPTSNLFGSNEDDPKYIELCCRSIASIHECESPRVSVSESQNLGFATAECIERGYFEMHAVMGFGDVGNRVATIYKWEPYVKFFKALIHNISCMNGSSEVWVQGNDCRWTQGEQCLSSNDYLGTPPKIVSLKARSGEVIARLEMDLESLISCAARADSCRYLIHCSRRRYEAIINVIAFSARQAGIPFVSLTPRRNWLARILQQW